MSRFENWKVPRLDADGWAYPNEVCKNMCEHSYGWRCLHSENLLLGYGCDIGCFTFINAKHGVTIEEDVQIGSHCSIYSENTENETQGKIIIGKGSLIGSHCLILPGVTIKPYSKIKAFSIVKE